MTCLLLPLSASSASDFRRPVLWVRGESVFVSSEGLAAGDRLDVCDAGGARRGAAVVARVGPSVAVVRRLAGPPPTRGWSVSRPSSAAERLVFPALHPPPTSVPVSPPPAAPPIPVLRLRRHAAVGPFVERWGLDGLPPATRAIGSEGGALLAFADGALLRVDLDAETPAAARTGAAAAPAGLEAHADLDGDGVEEVWSLGAELTSLRPTAGGFAVAGRSGPLDGAPLGLAAGRFRGRPALFVARRSMAGEAVVEILVGR